jgi:hypothetical protein
VRHFEELPQLTELLDRGGLPGVEYICVMTGNMAHYQEVEEFHPLNRMETFLVKGKSCTLLGKGKPVPHGRPESHRCPYHVDSELKEYLDAVKPRDEAKEAKRKEQIQEASRVSAKHGVTIKPGAEA